MVSSTAPLPAGEPILQVNQGLLPQFNTRVKLRPVEFEEEVADGIFLTKIFLNLFLKCRR